jgi:cobalt-zinc-cadmium resistance protein CzcA
MPPNASDTFIILKPREAWPDGVNTKDEVIERVERHWNRWLATLLRSANQSSCFNELIAGVRGDVAIKIYGDNLDEMGRTANRGSHY